MNAMIRRSTPLLLLASLVLASSCTTVENDLEMRQQSAPEPVSDDRPMPTWNRLMNETMPVVRRALERDSETFYPRGFVLSYRGGVRPVHVSPRAGADHEERLRLIFNSIEVMMQGDRIAAFVVYATGRGNLLNSSDEKEMVVVHMEHHSGKAVLRRLSYRTEGGSVSFGEEDVNSTKALVMGDSEQRQ